MNKDKIDKVLSKAFELEMESVVKALKKTNKDSESRFIMGNSNFLLNKVIEVANQQYTKITGLGCQKLIDVGNQYRTKVKALATI